MYAQCSQVCHPKTGTQRPGILYTSLEQIGLGVRNRGSTDNVNLGRRKWTVRRSWVGSVAEGQYLQATSAISFSLEKRKSWIGLSEERRQAAGIGGACARMPSWPVCWRHVKDSQSVSTFSRWRRECNIKRLMDGRIPDLQGIEEHPNNAGRRLDRERRKLEDQETRPFATAEINRHPREEWTCGDAEEP